MEEKEEGEEQGEQQEKEEEEEAEEKEEAPGVATRKNDQVEPAILTIHSGNKKSVDGLVKAGAPPKLFLCCLPRSVGLPRSEPALEGSLQFTLFLFPALADGCSLNGRPEYPDSRTCGLYRTREHESGQIVDQTTTEFTGVTAGLPDSLNSLKKKKFNF